LSLNGMKLAYRAGGNTTATDANPSVAFTSADMIPANGYFLITSTSYPLPVGVTANASLGAGGYSPTTGTIGLRDQNAVIVDSVAWGSPSSGNPFAQETPPIATPPPGGQSASRTPNGADTNSNNADFRNAAPTPGKQN